MMPKVLICFLAGTGFAGMSAAAVISPMLITFLDMPAYQAVGIVLTVPGALIPAAADARPETLHIELRWSVVSGQPAVR